MNFLKDLIDSTPGSEFSYYIPIIILSALLIIGSFVFSTIYKRKKKNDFAFKRLFKKVPRVMLIFGILYALILIFRYENIPYFSMRLWLYITTIVFLYFVYRYIKKFKVDYPKEKENVRLNTKKPKKSENKYLPHKKKK